MRTMIGVILILFGTLLVYLALVELGDHSAPLGTITQRPARKAALRKEVPLLFLSSNPCLDKARSMIIICVI